MIISEEKLIKNTEHIVAFDLLPTILTSLGFQYPGNQLALGYSAIGLNNADRPKNHSYDDSFYENLWHERLNQQTQLTQSRRN